MVEGMYNEKMLLKLWIVVVVVVNIFYKGCIESERSVDY